MPDFYLKPLFKAKGITCGSLRRQDEYILDDDDDVDEEDGRSEKEDKKLAKRQARRTWVPKVFQRMQRTTIPQVAPTYF
jgi:hypothetical protein